MNRLGLLSAAVPAALALVAGCFGPGGSRDAVATRNSAAILTPYVDAPRGKQSLSGLSASLNRAYGLKKGRPRQVNGPVLPACRAPDVELPGSPERAWVGPPRTRPYYPLALRPPASTTVTPSSGTGSGTGTTSTGTGLRLDRSLVRVGDILKVTVSGHPEFGGEWSVDARGNLSIPDGGAFGVDDDFTGEKFSGRVGRVSGMKLADLEAEISSRLRAYVRKAPQVTIEFAGRQGE